MWNLIHDVYFMLAFLLKSQNTEVCGRYGTNGKTFKGHEYIYIVPVPPKKAGCLETFILKY